MRYPSIPRAEACTAAVTLGRFILTRARETTYGLRFPEITKGGEVEYHDNLYKGAAGVGLTLLDLFQATGDSDFAQSAEQVGYDLIESTPGRHFLHPGLFSGQAGHVLFYLQAAHILKNPIFRGEACRLGDILADRPFHGTDIIAGAAGTGMVFLSLHSTFQKKEYLSAAQRALAFLKETAEQDRRGACWSPLIPEWRDNPDRFYTPYRSGPWSFGDLPVPYGVEHDSGGTKEQRLWPVLLSGGWIHTRFRIDPVYSGRSARPIPDSVITGAMEQQELLTLIWPGIVKTGHPGSGSRPAGRMDELEGSERSLSETWIHCHGISGCARASLRSEDVDSSPKWKQALYEFWPRIRSFVESIDSLEIQEGTGTSLSLGLAGLTRVLLRMAGKPIYPILTARRPPQRQNKVKTTRTLSDSFQVSKHTEDTRQ